VTLAAFYAFGVKESVPEIRTKQKAQLEQLNNLDEQANTAASAKD
jgi:hypothetical protein